MIRTAFVFPGQGSQTIGMLDGFENHPIVKETIDEASEALNADIGSLIATGPKELLDLTENTQPVMLTAAIACYRVWLSDGGAVPAYVAGHSLGEYSALVASGALAFKDAVPLVRFRAQSMQNAVPVGVGTMAAILGLTDDAVREICDEVARGDIVEAVNYNAPAQVVIAGHRGAVERACEAAKARGAKRALLLSVSAPFHSSLLRPASESLRDYLADIPFWKPSIPIINNVDVEMESDADAIKSALVRQAASPVRWVETVRKLASHKVDMVVECGPGKVLSGLTKRIDPTLQSETISDISSIKRLKEALQ